MAEHTDWRGTPIRVGDIIVYPTSASSSVTMHEARVAEIEEIITQKRLPTGEWSDFPQPILWVEHLREHTWAATRTETRERLTKLTRVDRVTVMESAAIIEAS